jgi:hypothetical protein
MPPPPSGFGWLMRKVSDGVSDEELGFWALSPVLHLTLHLTEQLISHIVLPSSKPKLVRHAKLYGK